MDQNLETAAEKILDSYGRWYDITRTDGESSPLIAKAAFHEHGTGYILVKKAQTWTADRHEYVWFYSVPHLDKDTYDKCLKNTLDEGMPMVNPVKGHMSTYLVNVIICDTADEDALKAVKKCHITKSFQFSLKGWMEVHSAVAEVGKSSVTANSAGRNTARFLESVLIPKGKHRIPFLNK